MTDQEMIDAYRLQILCRGGKLPAYSSDPEGRPMAIAKLSDIWAKLD